MKYQLATVASMIQLSSFAGAAITVTDSFSFAGDLAQNPAFTSTPGSDGNGDDNFGVDKPLTIPISGFTSVGSDKLVGVLTLHNSATQVSQVTGLSYGGTNVFPNIVVEDGAGGGNAFSTQIIFYLDSPTLDGDLLITLGAAENVDEAGVALFALDNALPGFLGSDSGDANPGTLTVGVGDFIVAAGHRNNGGVTSTATVGFTDNQFVLDAGNMTAGATYFIPGTAGTYGPEFANSQSSVIASFASIPEPSTSLLLGLCSLAGIMRRKR